MYQSISVAIMVFLAISSPINARIDDACLFGQRIILPNFNWRDTASVALSPNGQYFMQITRGGDAYYWTIDDTEKQPIIFERHPLLGQMYVRAQFSPKNTYAVIDSVFNNGNERPAMKFILVQLANAELINEFDTSIPMPSDLGWGSIFTFSPLENYLAYIGALNNPDSTVVSVYNLKNGTQKTFKADQAISALSFDPTENFLAVKSLHSPDGKGGAITVWNINSGAKIILQPERDFSDSSWAPAPDLIFSNDSSYIAVHSSNTMQAGIWDIKQKNMLFETSWFYQSAFQFLGELGAYTIGDFTGALKIWKVSSKNLSKTIYPLGQNSLITTIKSSPKGQSIVVASSDKLAVLDTTSLQTICSISTPPNQGFIDVAFKDQESFYSVSDNGNFILWKFSLDKFRFSKSKPNTVTLRVPK